MTISRSETCRFKRRIGLALAGTLVALACSAPMASAEELPASARSMTPGEVHLLYKDRSWLWSSGAGYMQDEGRQFTAFVDDEKGKSWADGRWTISASGRMCFKAVWHSADADTPATTCFSHSIDGETIYQKSEPDGAWYVFSHAPRLPEDEASKLVKADKVSEQLEAIKAALNPPTNPQ